MPSALVNKSFVPTVSDICWKRRLTFVLKQKTFLVYIDYSVYFVEYVVLYLLWKLNAVSTYPYFIALDLIPVFLYDCFST